MRSVTSKIELRWIAPAFVAYAVFANVWFWLFTGSARMDDVIDPAFGIVLEGINYLSLGLLPNSLALLVGWELWRNGIPSNQAAALVGIALIPASYYTGRVIVRASQRFNPWLVGLVYIAASAAVFLAIV